MTRRLLATSLLCLCCTAPVHAAEIAARTLEVHVTRPDGEPAAGALVLAMGIDRLNMFNPFWDGQGAGPHWTADANGVARIGLGDAKMPLERAASTSTTLGLGRYRFIVAPAVDHAGGYTELINNDAPEKLYDTDRGVMANVKAVTNVELKLKAGRVLTGTAVDENLKPLPGIHIEIANELHMLSHTGEGGEIFKQSATTDAQGHYALRNLHPGDLRLEVEGGLWLKRRSLIEKPEWRENDSDDGPELSDDPKKNVLDLMMVVHPKYEVYGRVTDATGKPLEGVAISVAISHHRTPNRSGDAHHGFDATTGADGKYNVSADSPWIVGVGAEKDGYGRQSSNGDRIDRTFPPGEYNFELKPK